MKKLIRVPKTPKSAYDPKRKVSDLLKAHIANLEAVTHRKHGVEPSKKPRTEGQASAYIAKLTQYLHPAAQYAPAPPIPPPPPAKRATTRRAGKK